MHEKRRKLIFLSQFLSRRKIYRLLQVDPDLKEVFTFTPTETSYHLQLTPENATRFLQFLHNDSLYKKILKQLKSYDIITIFDSTYPKHLRYVVDAPIVLYCLGDISLLQQEKMISVVGTRKPSVNAYRKLWKILPPLIEEDWIVTSGMAYGIDTYAHEMTLNERGKTIAVIGSGFDHIYPKENKLLFNKIVKNGLMVTEYPPYVKPKKYHFPERNRIISGLTIGTLVVEAKERSGTLITVDQALEQGKEVYAIPDSPLVEEAIGCLKLIEQGAKLVRNAMDIIEDWPDIY